MVKDPALYGGFVDEEKVAPEMPLVKKLLEW
jgi:hypothetical protein